MSQPLSLSMAKSHSVSFSISPSSRPLSLLSLPSLTSISFALSIYQPCLSSLTHSMGIFQSLTHPLTKMEREIQSALCLCLFHFISLSLQCYLSFQCILRNTSCKESLEGALLNNPDKPAYSHPKPIKTKALPLHSCYKVMAS